ncbi:MAG: DUF4097 family beta strand repeat protein [Acidobacteria bacterium]|nr:DUF4097 family beta strand repeat protein [Acidobacteriota bacterium]
MKLVGLMALAASVAAALPASAEQWSKTYNISGTPDLRVETSDANILVDTWDQKTIQATITSTRYRIGRGELEVDEHQTGDTVEITVHFPHRLLNFNLGNHRVDINIHMPRKGRVNLHTGDGKITLNRFGGEMELWSGDGAQTIHGVDGQLRALAADGRIDADGRFDRLDLKTSDGQIDVRVGGGSTIAEEWEVRTGDGSVSMELPASLAADVHLHTGDGHIDVNVPLTTDGRFQENDVRGKLNGGGKLMTIQTRDGSIALRKG